jgi:hypothetical protein
MKKKFRKLSLALLISAVVTFIITYFIYHYLTPNGFVPVWQPEPCKPYVTFLFAILGVLLLLSSIETFFVSNIFFKKEKE